MYSELVFYLEACESGSMFPYLSSNSNVYAMTASNAYQSSYAAYCGTDARVDGKLIGSCLGDLFSINWMEDTEANNISSESLQTQQATVIRETSASPVQTFGDFSFLSEPIGDFEGDLNYVDKSTMDIDFPDSIMALKDYGLSAFRAIHDVKEDLKEKLGVEKKTYK